MSGKQQTMAGGHANGKSTKWWPIGFPIGGSWIAMNYRSTKTGTNFWQLMIEFGMIWIARNRAERVGRVGLEGSVVRFDWKRSTRNESPEESRVDPWAGLSRTLVLIWLPPSQSWVESRKTVSLISDLTAIIADFTHFQRQESVRSDLRA